ncbi:hypothetical protein DJ55_4096 [Yersinia pseudotuberculosis]|nr:hypothetical protein DJ55_4096 [Yersinia pseudotuberculosis]
MLLPFIYYTSCKRLSFSSGLDHILYNPLALPAFSKKDMGTDSTGHSPVAGVQQKSQYLGYWQVNTPVPCMEIRHLISMPFQLLHFGRRQTDRPG